jgi:hypothetical protein
VSIAFFGVVEAEEALKKCPQARRYLVCTQYTDEKLKAQAGGRSLSLFLDTSQITSFCKKPDQVYSSRKGSGSSKASTSRSCRKPSANEWLASRSLCTWT